MNSDMTDIEALVIKAVNKPVSSSDAWANMSAEERKVEKVRQLEAAIKAVNSGAFPTGLVIAIGGKELFEACKTMKGTKTHIARPVRTTPSGGVSYSLGPQQGTLATYNTRLNKFSFSLLGSESSEAAFEGDESFV